MLDAYNSSKVTRENNKIILQQMKGNYPVYITKIVKNS